MTKCPVRREAKCDSANGALLRGATPSATICPKLVQPIVPLMGKYQFTVMVSVPRLCAPLIPATLACNVTVSVTGDGGGVGEVRLHPPFFHLDNRQQVVNIGPLPSGW